MKQHKSDYHKSSRRAIWLVVVVSLTIIVAGVTGVVKVMMGMKAPHKKQQVQQITLVKPPPPKVKEQLPEQKPEPVQQKEEVKEIVDVDKPQQVDTPQNDEPPPAGDLGVDGDATGSGDSFGLQARKGGAALVGGVSGGQGSLYGWYTNRYGSEIQRLFNQIVNEIGGINGNSLKTIIRVEIDDTGSIRGSIIGSSGNSKMDDAVLQALSRVTLREPPPPGMPRAMKLGVMSQG